MLHSPFVRFVSTVVSIVPSVMRRTAKALFIFLVFSLFPLTASAEDSVYVQVSAAKLRGSPAQWSDGVSNLTYGDSLQALEKKDGWYHVKTKDGKVGFVHESAVTLRKVVFTSKTGELPDLPLDNSTVVLAGKGFNDDVDKYFQAEAPLVDYKAVNHILGAPPMDGKKLHAFLVAGKLNLN